MDTRWQKWCRLMMGLTSLSVAGPAKENQRRCCTCRLWLGFLLITCISLFLSVFTQDFWEREWIPWVLFFFFHFKMKNVCNLLFSSQKLIIFKYFVNQNRPQKKAGKRKMGSSDAHRSAWFSLSLFKWRAFLKQKTQFWVEKQLLLGQFQRIYLERIKKK